LRLVNTFSEAILIFDLRNRVILGLLPGSAVKCDRGKTL